MPAIKGIYQDGALVYVKVSAWSGSIQLTPEDLGFTKAEVVDAFNLGNKMLIPKDINREFTANENRARRVADSPNGLKFPIGTSRFVPKGNIPKVIAFLQESRAQRLALADALATNLEAIRLSMVPQYLEAAEAAYLQLKPSGVETFSIEDEESKKKAFVDAYLDKIKACYPSPEAIRAKYDIEWTVFEIGETTSEFATEEWKQQSRAKISGWLDTVVGELRTETVTICKHVADAIKDGKVIRSSTVDSLKSFIEKFKGLNFVGDSKIEEELIAFKRDVLDPHSPEQLSEPEMQAEMKRRLALITEAASDISDCSVVAGQYRRKINWEV
jgi:hypothetical protein